MPFEDHSKDLLSSPHTAGSEGPLRSVEVVGPQLNGSEERDSSLEHVADRAATTHTSRQRHMSRSDKSGRICRRHSLDLDERSSSCSRHHSTEDDTKSWRTPARSSAEREPHPLLTFLPSLSFLPPLLHRYTGTTTESLLVGVTCCVINIALYITSGVVTRVLQQQEHVATHQTDQTAQLDQTAPCPPAPEGNGAAACSVRVPEVTIEHLRVPYMMVWLPQVCQIFFLFIALASIRRKYEPRVLGNMASPRPEVTDGRVMRDSNRGTAGKRSTHGRVEPDVEALMPRGNPESTSEGLVSDIDRDSEFPREAKSASPRPSVGVDVSTRNDSTQGRLRVGCALSTEHGTDTAEHADGYLHAAANPQTEKSDSGLRSCWRALTEQCHSHIYVPHLKGYHICVQAYLKEEMKYESLGRLVLACFFVVCLYILQGWFWSIAVGSTGMSVCSVTAIYSTNSLFVFLFTSLIYKEGTDDFIQMVALILATVGVALIAYESQGEPQSTTGVILSICSSATYGLFEVLYKMYLLQNRSNHPLTFVFFVSGLMGALALVFLWVPMPILHAFNLETFPRSPPPFLALFMLALSCICSTIYNILLQVSLMLLPSPMLVAMCFLLSLPPAAASDALQGGGGGVGSSGCAFIAFSLVITGIKEWSIKEREEQLSPDFGDLCMPFVFGFEQRMSSAVQPDPGS